MSHILRIFILLLFTASALPFLSRTLRFARQQSLWATSSLPQSKATDIERHFADFDKLFNDNIFDSIRMTKLHHESIIYLVKSDVRNRDEGSCQLETFPAAYVVAIKFIEDFVSALKDQSHPMYSTSRLIVKKEGLNKLCAQILDVEGDIILPQREIVEIKRKTERVLSQLMTLSVAYRCAEAAGSAKDLLYFSKGLLENTPIHDRHFALLVLCRGILAPPYGFDRKVSQDDIQLSDVSGLLRSSRPALMESFRTSMGALGITQPSMSARVLYPFASTALRCLCAVKSGEYDVLLSPQRAHSQHYPPLQSRSNGDPSQDRSITSDFSSLARARKIPGSTSDVESMPSSGSGATASMFAVSSTYSPRGTQWLGGSAFKEVSFLPEDLQLGRLLWACMEVDREAERQRSLTEAADEVLVSLRRWICDLAAVHFINSDEELLSSTSSSSRIALPEEVRKNTVAMELLCTENAFCKGRRMDRARFVQFFAEIGNYLYAMTTFLPPDVNKLPMAPAHRRPAAVSGASFVYDDDDQDCQNRFLSDIKKTMAVVSSGKYLPQSHPLRISLDGGGVAGLGVFPPVIPQSSPLVATNSAIISPSIRGDRDKDATIYSDGGADNGGGETASRVIETSRERLYNNDKVERDEGEVEDGVRTDSNRLNQQPKRGNEDEHPNAKKPRMVKSVVGYATSDSNTNKENSNISNDDDDDDMWGEPTSKRATTRVLRLSSTNSSNMSATSKTTKLSPSSPTLIHRVDNYLLQILADILKIDESTLLDPASKVREEVDYVFSTWRKPQLLLDYYRMHRSSPEIQAVYVRFLSALFGVTKETFEDIRYKDPGNRRHLDRLPEDLVSQWIEGRTKENVIIPGYSDPQTLFMLGEDSHTCMSIRARQKGTNRGLLSILLQGNCRVVGTKDSSGKLIVRSVVRLLVDDATKLPVLYVDTPYGNVNDEDELVQVYDQAAEIGNLLKLPVVYASAPAESLYVMGARETPAALPIEAVVVQSTNKNESSRSLKRKGTVLSVSDRVKPLSNISDFSQITQLMWVDGIKDPVGGSYLSTRVPLLTKRSANTVAIVAGARPVGAIEAMLRTGVELRSAVSNNKRQRSSGVDSERKNKFGYDDDDDSLFVSTKKAGDDGVLAQIRRSAALSRSRFKDNNNLDNDLFGDSTPSSSSSSVSIASSSVSTSSSLQMSTKKKRRRIDGKIVGDGSDEELFAATTSTPTRRIALSRNPGFGEDDEFFGTAQKYIQAKTSTGKGAIRSRGTAEPTTASSAAHDIASDGKKNAAANDAGDFWGGGLVARAIGRSRSQQHDQQQQSEQRETHQQRKKKEIESEDDLRLPSNFELSETLKPFTGTMDEATVSAVEGGDYSSLLSALQIRGRGTNASKKDASSSSSFNGADSVQDSVMHMRNQQRLSVQARQAERSRLISERQFEAQRLRGLRKDESEEEQSEASEGHRDSKDGVGAVPRTEAKAAPTNKNPPTKLKQREVIEEEEDDGLWG